MRTLCVAKAQVPAWECLTASAYGVLSLSPLWISLKIPVPVGVVPSVCVVATVASRNADVESGINVANAIVDPLVNFFFCSRFQRALRRARWFIFVFLVESEITSTQYNVETLQNIMIM